MAEKALLYLPAAIRQHQNSDWATPDVCAQRLGLTDWNRLTVLEEVARRVSDAPFTNQCNHSLRMNWLTGQLVRIRQRLQSSHSPQARALYEKALQQQPEDFWLYHNYAEFLKATGDLATAANHMQKFCELTPQNATAFLQLGRLQARQSKFAEAHQALQQALRLRPNSGEVYLEMGQTFDAQGRWEEALTCYATAQACRPDDATAHWRRAEVWLKQHKPAEAIQSLREAIRLQPSQWEAHYLLGMELATENKNREAEVEFQTVLQFQPDHVLSQLNLGIVLTRQARFKEALDCFQETLRLDPRNPKAQEFIDQIEQLSRVN